MRGGVLLKQRARSLRGNLTDAEQALWRALRRYQLGARFRRQFPVPPYVVDFACVEARLIVECDGGQHSQLASDIRRDALLRQRGWHILRFWNNEILGNLAGVLERIGETLKQVQPLNPHPGPPPLAGEGAEVSRGRAVPSARRAENVS